MCLLELEGVCLLEDVRRYRPFLRRRGVLLRDLCGEASLALISVLASMAKSHRSVEENHGGLRIAAGMQMKSSPLSSRLQRERRKADKVQSVCG